MVWFTLALFVVSFVYVAVFAPKPKQENARPGVLGDIRFPRASEGSPIPIIFGKVRLRSPNVIWYGDFASSAVKKKIKTSLFTSKKVVTGYTYYVGFDLALCLGPSVVLHKIWVEKRELSSAVSSGDGVTVTINQANIFGGPDQGGGFEGVAKFYSGSFTQTPNAYLESVLGTGEVPAYNGICHIVFEKPYIGTSPQLRALSFELSRMPNNLSLVGGVIDIGDDINPAEVIYSALTEAWGGANLDPAFIDTASFVSVASILATEGNGISLSVQGSNQAKVVISEALRQIDGIMYQDPTTGKIVLDLIRDDYTVGGLPVLGPSEIDRVTNFSRTAWIETFNQVRVIYNSRQRNYEDGGAIAQDMANIRYQGHVNSTTLNFPGCTEEILANQLAWRELASLAIPLYRAKIQSNRNAIELRPGSPFVWNWPDYGISGAVMRVQDFDPGDLVDGRIGMNIIQDKFAVSNALFADPAETLWAEDTRPAVDITELLVMASPRYFVDQFPDITGDDALEYLWALARNPSDMLGYDFLTSTDIFVNDITTELDQAVFPTSATVKEMFYANMGQEDGYLVKIIIENVLPAGVSSFPSVSLSTIKSDGANLIMIGGEILAFESATDNGDGSWTLNDVRRALLDTTFEDHTVGDIVYFLNSVDWLSENPHSLPFSPIGYKYLSFTDRDTQEVGDVAIAYFSQKYRYRRPVAPDRILIDTVRTPIEVVGVDNVDVSDWRDRDRATDTIVLVDDADGTPETSSFFNLYFKLDGIQLDATLGASGSPPFNLNGLEGKGLGRVEVFGTKGGYSSLYEEFVEFFYALYQNLGSELMGNNDFTSLTSWTVASGSFSIPSTDLYPLQPRTGNNFLLATGSTNEIYQHVDVVAEQGKAGFFRAYRGSKVTGAQSQVILEQRTFGDSILNTITAPLASADPGKWDVIDIPFPILSTCDHVRVRLLAPTADVAFEFVTLKASSVSTTSGVQYDSLTGLTATGAWGLRQMISTYSGPLVRIRDTDDDSEQDLGFDADGNLVGFATMGEARVVKLYDQSGSGVDLEPDEIGDQPLLRTGLSETGRAEIIFEKDGLQNLKDQTQSTSRPYMTTRPNMCIAIGPRVETSQAGYIAIFPHDGTVNTSPYYRWGLNTATSTWAISVDGTQRIITGTPSIGKHVWCLDHQNGNAYRNDDVTPVDTWTATDTTYPNATALMIPEAVNGYLPWEGVFHELCIYSGNISAGDRKTMMESVALYWFNLSI